jgi:hypothetical protein
LSIRTVEAKENDTERNQMDKNLTDIRRPAVAGQFYPGDAAKLAKLIAGYFAKVDKVAISGRPTALICPHAGYQYSGKVAAKAYKLLEGEQYDTVVVVSPYHRNFFQGCSVYEGDGYETPLGVIEIDTEVAEKIGSINPLVYLSRQGHGTGAQRGEHSLEVQLPFLQIVLGKFKLVPIIMGDQEEESVRGLGEVLASVLNGRNALMVASTDLSHFHPEKEANRLDGKVREAIESFDPAEVMRVLSSGEGEACGGGPVAAVMTAAKRLGSDAVKFIDYRTSGATTGDFNEVVGYLSAAMALGTKAQGKLDDKKQVVDTLRVVTQRHGGALIDEQRQQLHVIAREAIAAALEDREYAPIPSDQLALKRGAFVTLKIDGKLRGCIGQVRARDRLDNMIADMAHAAAFEDPRFPKLTKDEYEQLEYEISVMSPLERVKDFSKIKVGRDGLMLKLDMHSGLLLPQVASEYGWSAAEFLEQVCLKADLPKDAYKDEFAEVYKFSADVF